MDEDLHSIASSSSQLRRDRESARKRRGIAQLELQELEAEQAMSQRSHASGSQRGEERPSMSSHNVQ